MLQMDGEGEPGFSRYFWKLLQDPNSDSLEQKSVMRGEGCSLPCSRIYFPLWRFIPGSPDQIAGGLLCLCFFPGNELFFFLLGLSAPCRCKGLWRAGNTLTESAAQGMPA